MPGLSSKVQNSLDEARMLMLGTQVLVGFHFEAVLQHGFDRLPDGARWAMVVGLGLLIAAVGLNLWPAAHHVLVWNGEDRRDQVVFTNRVLCWALAPVAAGLTIDMYVVAEVVAAPPIPALAGLAGAVTAVAAWYVWPWTRRPARPKELPMEQEHKDRGEALEQKIRHMLTEARMTLPGAQALLGFGTVAVLMQGFAELDRSLQAVHLVSVGLIALSTVLLIAPAAFHRVATDGENTELVYRTGSRLLLAGMATLALGIAAETWVVVEKVTASRVAGIAAASAVAIVLLGMWFGWTAWKRRSLAGRGAGRSRVSPRLRRARGSPPSPEGPRTSTSAHGAR